MALRLVTLVAVAGLVASETVSHVSFSFGNSAPISYEVRPDGSHTSPYHPPVKARYPTPAPKYTPAPPKYTTPARPKYTTPPPPPPKYTTPARPKYTTPPPPPPKYTTPEPPKYTTPEPPKYTTRPPRKYKTPAPTTRAAYTPPQLTTPQPPAPEAPSYPPPTTPAPTSYAPRYLPTTTPAPTYAPTTTTTTTTTTTIKSPVYHPQPSYQPRRPYHPPPPPPPPRYQPRPYHPKPAPSYRPTPSYGHPSVPACAKMSNGTWCVEDEEYPEYEVKHAIQYHMEKFHSLYADVAELDTELSVERPNTLEEETYLCPSETAYISPLRAQNTDGYWRVIVNNINVHYETFTQTTRIEECLTSGEDCPKVPMCYESKCLQKSIYHRFLVYDPYDQYFPFAIETFKLPASCACLLGAYTINH